MDLFNLKVPLSTHYRTYDNDRLQVKPPPDDSDCNSDLSVWHHATSKKGIDDMAIKAAWEAGISFVFHHKSHDQIQVA